MSLEVMMLLLMMLMMMEEGSSWAIKDTGLTEPSPRNDVKAGTTLYL